MRRSTPRTTCRPLYDLPIPSAFNVSIQVSARFRRHFGAVVSVVVLRPPPSTVTLLSRLWKINASPVTVPCAGSFIFGGTAAVPVSTYSPVSPVYTNCSPRSEEHTSELQSLRHL